MRSSADAPLYPDAHLVPTPIRLTGLLIAVVLTVLVLGATAPRTLYPGDAIAIRLSAEELVRHGRLDVPPEVASRFGERGQYFFENPSNRLWYPKYGVANAILFAIPLSFECWTAGRLPTERMLSPSEFEVRRWWLNAFNLGLSGILAAYLCLLAGRESNNQPLVIGFVLATLFSTFAWTYLRAHTVELFQLLTFTAAWFHAVRAAELSSDMHPRFTWHASASMGALGWLVLGKLVYAPLLAVIPAFIGFKAWNGQRDRRSGRLLLLVCLVCAIASLTLYANWQRFGSPWNTGYSQWEPERDFLRGDLPRALLGYAIDSRASVFLYFPPVVLGLAGLFGIKRDRRAEWAAAWTGFGILLLINSSFVNWRGEWCYGPRYLLFALPVLSLPGLAVLDRASHGRSAAARLAVGGATMAIVLWSLQHQVRANMLDFLMPTRVAGLFKPLEDDVLSDYFWKRPYWSINTDLVWFAIGRRKFPPLEHVRDRIPAPAFEALSAEVRRSVSLNLLWTASAGHPERRPAPTEDGQRSARSADPPGR